MKRLTNVLLAATIVAFAASCQKEIEQVVVPEGNGFTVLTAKTDNDLKTRTSLNGLNVVWTAEDVITAFHSGGYCSSEKTELQNEEGTIVKFTVPTKSPEYAVYPVVSQDMVNGQIPAKIPISQNAKSGSFDNGANVAIAKVTDPNDIHFKNVGGLLAVKIKATTHTIKSIKISAEGTNMTGDILSSIDAEGNVNTSFSTAGDAEVADYVEITSSSGFEVEQTYYAVVAPGTYNNVTIVFTDEDGKTATYTKNSALVVERNSNQLIGGFSPDESNKWVSSEKYYVKVTSDEDLLNGKYLIVYEGGVNSDNVAIPSVAFNGGLETLDVVSNTINVEVADNKILSTETTDNAAFTISIDDETIKSFNGDYIGVSTNSNSLKQGDEATKKNHSFDIDEDGNALIVVKDVNENMTLRYNYASNQLRFRYYKNAGQQPIALYLLEGSGTPVKPFAELSFSSSSLEITQGESFTAPALTTNPTGIDVTYSSSTPAVATVDETSGEVTILSPGTTVITASFAGNDSYRAASASYTLKVNSSENNGDGTLENPFNIAGAYEFINNSGTGNVYIKGIISRIDEGKEFSESFGTAVFWISDDGTTETNQFEAYSVYFLGNRSWRDGNTQIKVGDEVIIYGEVTKFNSTYETSSKKAYVYSLNGVSTILDAPNVTATPVIENNQKKIQVSWPVVTGATQYSVALGEDDPSITTDNEVTITVQEYGSYQVRVIAYGNSIEPGVSELIDVVISDPNSVSGLTAKWTLTSGESTSLASGMGNTSALLTVTNNNSNKINGYGAGIASQKMKQDHYWLFTIPDVSNVSSTSTVTISFSGVKVNKTENKVTYQLAYSWDNSTWIKVGDPFTETTTAVKKEYSFSPGQKESGTLYIRYYVTGGGKDSAGSHYLGEVSLNAQ